MSQWTQPQVGEDQEVVLVVGEDHPLEEVALLGVGADDALAAPGLGAVDVRRHPLDVAVVGEGDQHLALGDEGLVLDLELLLLDLGAAGITVARLQVLQVGDDQGVDLAHVTEDLLVAGDGRLEIAPLLLELLDLEAGQAREPHRQDRVGLPRGEQEAARELHLGLDRGRRGLDHLDHFVDVRDGHQQAFDDVQPLFGLALQVAGAALDDLDAVIAELGEELLDAEGARALIRERQHDQREGGLERGVAEELVQDHVGLMPLLDLEDQAQPFLAVGLVVGVADALDDLVADEGLDLVEDVDRVDLVGQLGDDDLLAILAHRLDVGAGPQGDQTAAGRVRPEDPAASADDAPGGEIRTRDVLHQLGDRDLGIADQGHEGVGDLAEVVGRDRGGHAHRDSLGAVAEQVREAGRQHRGLVPGVVVVAVEIDGLLVEIVEQIHGREGEAGLGVTHRRGRRAVDGAEVPLLVDQGVAHVEVLGEAHQGRVDHPLAVGVVVAGGVAGDLGALPELGAGPQVQVVHRHQDAPLGGLQTVPGVGERPLDDHAHGVGQVGVLELLVEREVTDDFGRYRPRLGSLIGHLLWSR